MRPARWLDATTLALGLLEVALLPVVGLHFGPSPDPVPAWSMVALWAGGVLLSGWKVRTGGKLNGRQAIAILPGLLVVTHLPRLGAIPVLLLLGAVLLALARRRQVPAGSVSLISGR